MMCWCASRARKLALVVIVVSFALTPKEWPPHAEEQQFAHLVKLKLVITAAKRLHKSFESYKSRKLEADAINVARVLFSSAF